MASSSISNTPVRHIGSIYRHQYADQGRRWQGTPMCPAMEHRGYPRGVSFRPESLQARGPGQAAGPGEVDYRLVRKHTLDEFRRGRLSKLDVCDAHPELLRAARNVGEARSED